MIRAARGLSALGGMVVVATVAAGCAEASGADSQTPMTPPIQGQAPSGSHEGHDGTTGSTVNGVVPPNRPTRLVESVIVLNVVHDGQRHLVFRDTRSEGTRSAIHVHPHGGVTCVESGEMTLYLEGSDPQVAGAGQCYWMPPGKPMSGVNSGGGPAVLTEMFTVPDGEGVWRVVEQGQLSLQEDFGTAKIYSR